MQMVVCNLDDKELYYLSALLAVCTDTHLQPCQQGCSQGLAEFQHVNCMIVRIWEVKRVA